MKKRMVNVLLLAVVSITVSLSAGVLKTMADEIDTTSSEIVSTQDESSSEESNIMDRTFSFNKETLEGKSFVSMETQLLLVLVLPQLIWIMYSYYRRNLDSTIITVLSVEQLILCIQETPMMYLPSLIKFHY